MWGDVWLPARVCVCVCLCVSRDPPGAFPVSWQPLKSGGVCLTMCKETTFRLRINPSDRKVRVGGSDLPGGPNTCRALSSPREDFLSWSYLHRLTGPDVVPGGARTKAAFLGCPNTAMLSTDFTKCKVERKGNPEIQGSETVHHSRHRLWAWRG